MPLIRSPRRQLLMAAWLLGAAAAASELEYPTGAMTPCSTDDRLLVIAPHEDDETLGAGGALQQARTAGAKTRVIYLTYGDRNEFAFLVYGKLPPLLPIQNRHMGLTRRRESERAMAFLGLAPEDLTFFGYPDHGVLNIWLRGWGAAKPLRSLTSNATAVPYRDAANYGAPYKGESVLADLGRELAIFRPTRILVTHPGDANPDHVAAYLFLQLALLQNRDLTPWPEIFCYPVHFSGFPRPRGGRLDADLAIPPRAGGKSADWSALALDPEQVRRKALAIGYYKTQTSVRPRFLHAFARRREIFWRSRWAVVPTDPTAPLTWVLNTTGENEDYEAENPPAAPGDLRLWQAGDILCLEAIGSPTLAVRLFAFRDDRPFAELPKLTIRWNGKNLAVQDRGQSLPDSRITGQTWENTARLRVPWAELATPQAVFAQLLILKGEEIKFQSTAQVLLRNRDFALP